jgi:hypothetical protein
MSEDAERFRPVGRWRQVADENDFTAVIDDWPKGETKGSATGRRASLMSY